VLFALRQPATLLGLLLGFAASMIALTAVQARIAGIKRGAAATFHPRTWIDPYSGVAALLGGIGWAPRPEVRRGFGRDPRRVLWILAVAAVVVPAILAAVGFAAFFAANGPKAALKVIGSSDVIFGGSIVGLLTTGQQVALGFAVECVAIAVLSVVPIPPLATGVAVWTQFPKTPGARRTAYHLLEEQWGIGILMVLMLPIINLTSILVVILSPLFDDILRAV
jgi:hypothetical protein